MYTLWYTHHATLWDTPCTPYVHPGMYTPLRIVLTRVCTPLCA